MFDVENNSYEYIDPNEKEEDGEDTDGRAAGVNKIAPNALPAEI